MLTDERFVDEFAILAENKPLLWREINGLLGSSFGTVRFFLKPEKEFVKAFQELWQNEKEELGEQLEKILVDYFGAERAGKLIDKMEKKI